MLAKCRKELREKKGGDQWSQERKHTGVGEALIPAFHGMASQVGLVESEAGEVDRGEMEGRRCICAQGLGDQVSLVTVFNCVE
jgi:hypothetical protein